MSFAIVLHLLAAIIWLGGMFFAYMCMRPAASQMFEPAVRLPFLYNAMGRFFNWVWLCVFILPVTGIWMATQLYGSVGSWPHSVLLMLALGIIMILLFIFVFLAPYRRVGLALKIDDFASAGKNMEHLRRVVGLNLLLGTVVIISASAGRYIS